MEKIRIVTIGVCACGKIVSIRGPDVTHPLPWERDDISWRIYTPTLDFYAEIKEAVCPKCRG